MSTPEVTAPPIHEAPVDRVKPLGRRSSMADSLWSLVAIAAAVLFFFPLYWAISTALRNPADTFTVAGLGIPWLDFQPTLNNFAVELSTPEGWRALQTSLIVSLSAVALALALGLPAAYALARFRFWSNSDITIWFLSQRVLPPVATLLPFYIVFRSLDMLDSKTALILCNATFILPFVVVILRQTFLDLPVELEEAALVDGASHWGAFLRVALPLAAPAVAATAMIIFAFAWNEFLFSSSLGITETKMMPAHMAGAVDTRGVQFWFMATRALIAMIPPVLLALFAQRYIVRGLTLGAVKG
ncbi:carbohydrate ABC transporter permease [Inquilinus sp. Marseille-Q2685]|uniref:carbohydrate ABC transporter permease n=1 Tax=Inquilinus sp. Marseille-Q2685 TaxID=2866581 RepID=UPI001CE47279|nr:carbohydrate ABC transporter permease [Inquilinus sp. Marseille-Q2685]